MVRLVQIPKLVDSARQFNRKLDAEVFKTEEH